MKKFFFFVIFSLSCIYFFSESVFALCESSSSCILIDNNSGRVLYSKNSNEKKLIASTTKLMTFLVAYENGNLDKEIEAQEEILKMYGTSIYLSLGEKMTLRDLLYGLILRSGNDASVVIANNIFDSYDEFIAAMNKRAKELGMNDTIFLNPHGLDEETENYSTSYDMALLSRYLHSIPFYLEVSSTKHYETTTSLKAYDWYNRNKLLLGYKYTISGKNGYTPSAGKTLVSGAMKGGLSLTAVSLEDSDIYNTHIALYEYGFSNYTSYTVLNKDVFSYHDDNYNGELYIKNSFSYPILESEKEKLEIVVQIIKDVDVDITNKVGYVVIYFDNEEIYREDLYIKMTLSNSTKFFFNKIWDFVCSFFS